MDGVFDPSHVKGVIFDAFGTLVYIANARRPYRRLLDAAAQAGRVPRADDAANVMSRRCGLAEVASWLDAGLSLIVIGELERELVEEVATVRPYPEARTTINRLRDVGLKVGVCSNLAAPYAVPIYSLLPDAFDACVWSFDVGAVKPDPAIYAAVCATSNLAPEELLFVGDTYAADVMGPRAFGMQAIHLARNGQSPEPGFLRELGELVPMLVTGRDEDQGR